MPVILIALCERERRQGVPSNVQNEQLGHDAPDLYSAERELEVRNWGECEDQGTVTERLPEALPQHKFDDDHVGKNALDTVRPGRPEGERRSPDNTPINIYQLRIVPGGTRRFGLLPFSLMLQRSPQTDSVLSKLS
jgi:hypothetical protein